MDTERYEVKDQRVADYTIAEVLHLQSMACEPICKGKVAPKFILMTYTPRRDFYIKFLQEPMPLESQLPENLHSFLLSEIASGSVKTKQEVVEWLTTTFMFRRLTPNPNFYNLEGRAPE